jgi:hypothetical protein
MNVRRTVICALLGLALVVAGCTPAGPPTAPVTIDPAELEDFADEFFPGQLKNLYIPGLVFVSEFCKAFLERFMR